MGFCDGAVSPSVTGLAQIQVCVGLNTLKAFEASSQTFFPPSFFLSQFRPSTFPDVWKNFD
jgi:hypothetical protein